MTKITGDNVKNAVVNKLMELFPNTAIYKESITTPSFPHFFVYELSLTNQEERHGVFILNYMLNIRYRIASDPSTDLKLNNNLDDVAIVLLENFNLLDLGDEKIRCTDNSCEKVDGVLHFNCNISIMARVIDTSTHIKQNTLSINID